MPKNALLLTRVSTTWPQFLPSYGPPANRSSHVPPSPCAWRPEFKGVLPSGKPRKRKYGYRDKLIKVYKENRKTNFYRPHEREPSMRFIKPWPRHSIRFPLPMPYTSCDTQGRWRPKREMLYKPHRGPVAEGGVLLA